MWPHATSTPYQPQSNSLIERQVGVIIQGTRASLLQSGLPHKMWPFASKHHAMATNMTVSASALDGLSPYEGHMKEPFAGMMIPFGALVHYRPEALPRHAPQVRAPVVPWDLPRMVRDRAWSSRATASSSR